MERINSKFYIFITAIILLTILVVSSSSSANSASDRIIAKGKLNCMICKTVAMFGLVQIRTFNTSEATISKRIKSICHVYYGAISSREVCDGLIDRLLPSLYYIIRHRPDLDRNKLCGYIFQQFGCNNQNDPKLDWNIDLPVSSTEQGILISSAFVDDRLSKRSEEEEESWRQIKILHLTDLHIDPLYSAGSEANCENRVLCCHSEHKTYNGKDNQGSLKAGTFGHKYKCDPPLSFLNLTLQNLVKEHNDIDLVYMSGDIVPHSVYYTSPEENMEIVGQVSQLIYHYFPNTTIIPMVGNHEPHPVNMFSPEGVPPELSTRWVYNATYEFWKEWIPLDQKENYLKEGFYAVEKSGKFKIISINTNVCYGLNFWGMLGDVQDPGGQLSWLVSELEEAELKGQSVHIVGHIAPAHIECSHVWGKNYYKIISRYHKIIRGQFFGHTHHDSFRVYYAPTNSVPGGEGICREPISALFISPSLTGYKGNNPSYKIFYANSSTWEVQDYEAYILDLDEANKLALNSNTSSLNWQLLYRATSTYDMEDVRPGNLGLLVERMAGNKKLFKKFYNHFYSMSSPTEKVTPELTKKYLCELVEQYGGLSGIECERVKLTVDADYQRQEEREYRLYHSIMRPMRRLKQKLWPTKLPQLGNCHPRILVLD